MRTVIPFPERFDIWYKSYVSKTNARATCKYTAYKNIQMSTRHLLTLVYKNLTGIKLQ